ncbi:hypothetical protein VNO77_43838 [Canavalia gladiata]|uniref:Cation/H+ exchanger domain-containing protein n=1 Tax=Canavalia gladiata TaxID=3824 RepID=A0AAN9JUV1_CANGL
MATSRENGTASVHFNSLGPYEVCVKDDRNVGSYGIFFGDRPLDFVLPVTLCQLCIVIVFSRALYFLLRPMKTPKFTCNVLGGILLGPSFLGRSSGYWEVVFPPRQSGYLILVSLVGATYFLFIIALKMDVRMTIRGARSYWRLGVIPFVAAFVVVSALLDLYHKSTNIPSSKLSLAHTALSAIMAFSTFPVISEALIELNLIATELGQIAMSSCIINDLIHWLYLAVAHLMLLDNLKSSILFMVSLFLFILICIFILRPAMKMIARSTPVGRPVKEIYVVFILLGVLVMAGLADAIGISFLIGSFIFGIIIPSGPPLGTTIVERSEYIISEFLLPFFFIYIGMNANISHVHRDWKMFITLQGIFLAGVLAKLLVSVLVCLTYNIRPRHGAILGLMLNIKGITELIAFAKLKKLKLLDEETFSNLVFSVVFTTASVAPLVEYLYKHRPRLLEGESLYEGDLRTIQKTARTTEFRIICCVHSEANVRGMTTLLEAFNPVLESPICVYVIHFIELMGQSSSILLPIKFKQNKKFLSVNYPNTNPIIRAFENYSNNSSGPVTVLPYINIAPYKSMHDAVCNLSHDKLVPLIIIPFHENNNIDLAGYVATSIRKMNSTLQARAPCSLGVLVDRNSRLGVCNTNLFFNVGVIFIGGADDREALALAIRMSDRSNTRVSLFRFVVMRKKLTGGNDELSKEEQLEEQEDMMMDEGLIDEFKSMRFGNGCVSWYDITVEDGVEVLDAIRNLEGNYDLVMVGRRHPSVESLNDEEMANFIENAENLGTVGDMLSSTEFCMGMVPVLVTRCGGKGAVSTSNSKLDRLSSVNFSQKSLPVD